MEKSDSKTSQNNGSGDEKVDQKDEEQPTTSKGDTFNPVQISHNMNDLKALDFNSADEVRQAMKALLGGNVPPQSFTEEVNHIPTLKVQTSPEPIKVNEPVGNQLLLGQDVNKKNNLQSQVRQTHSQRMKTTAQIWPFKQSTVRPPERKRRGRPPKAGPSKRIKKRKVSTMYLGKLSNVVPFRRRWESESESDVESVVIFY